MTTCGGVDLGGTKIQAVVAEGDRVLGQDRRSTPREGGPEAVAAAIVASASAAAANAELTVRELGGVGVGSPGVVDDDAGTVSQARNLPGWAGSFPLASRLAEALGTSVRLGNDVSVATGAEFRFGAGTDHDSLLGVFWGTGVGGGLVLDRRQWTGAGGAGEIGHMVISRGGRRCPCGRRGCLEAYAGRAALEARARKLQRRGKRTALFEIMEERGRDRLTSGIWWRAIERGDTVATKLIDGAIEALGAGIASAVNLLDVPLVVIGGGLGVRFGQDCADRIAAAMRPHLFADHRPPEVKVAALGDLGGALGAALLVAEGPERD